MPISVVCSSCGTEATVPESAAGKKGRCRQCHAVVAVPSQNGGTPTCFMCDTDLSQSEHTKDASGNHYCVECWKLKLRRQQQAKAAIAPITAGIDDEGDGYDLVPEPQRPVIRATPSPLGQTPLGTRRRMQEKTADELYADVPWYRRSGPLSVVNVISIFVPGPIILVLFSVLTGPVYERKLAAPGQLKMWGGGNRIAAIVILLLWIGIIVFKMQSRGETAIATNSPSASPPPTVTAQVTPRVAPVSPPKPAVSYRASVGDISQEGVLNAANLPPVTAPPVPVALPTIAPSRPPLTDAKSQAWAKELEQATATGDMGFLTRSIDAEGLARRAVAGITTTDESMQKVKSLADDLIKDVGDMGEPLIKNRPCKVLWTRQAAGDRVAMVRCLLKEGDVDYLRLTLAPNDRGDVRVVDIFELGSGGEWSRLLRTVALALVVSADADALHSLSPADKDIINNAALLGTIYRKNDSAQLQELPSLIGQLPPSLQADRYLSILNVKATAQSSDAVFNAAVERHQQRFPNDPSLSFATFQKRVHDKDYVKMLEALFTLDKAVGGDPFIAAMKADAYTGIGNVALAKQNAQEAVAKEPSLAPPHWILLYVAVEEKNHAETARLLTLLEKDLGETIPDVKQEPDLAAFAASPQYRAWVAARGAKSGQVPSKPETRRQTVEAKRGLVVDDSAPVKAKE